MNPSSEIEYEIPGLELVHKSGRVERLQGTETVPPCPSGEPASGVVSKDVVLDPTANISARLYRPAIRGGIDRVWKVACGGEFGLDHPYINPSAASPEEWKQLGCRRVLVATAELCWFVERSRAYVEGIKASGWDGELEFHETKGDGHVYFLLKPDCDNAAKELAVVADFVRRC